MTTDPIKALVNLGPELETEYGRLISLNNYKRNASISRDALAKIITAIEALKPVVDGTHVVVGSVFLNDLRAIADTGGRRIETAMDACDKIVELIDMEARLGPATSPAPVDGELVERVARALHLHDFPRSPWEEVEEIFKNQWRSKSRAALASVKEVE